MTAEFYSAELKELADLVDQLAATVFEMKAWTAILGPAPRTEDVSDLIWLHADLMVLTNKAEQLSSKVYLHMAAQRPRTPDQVVAEAVVQRRLQALRYQAELFQDEACAVRRSTPR